jgi:hypothetical protein
MPNVNANIPSMAGHDPASVLDVSKYPTAQKCLARCVEFFDEVKNL